MKFKRKIRFKLFDRILIYGFITWLERVKGVTSIMPLALDSHYILFDFDNMELRDVILSLEKIISKYKLNGIIIFSDKALSYRAFSDNIVQFKTLLQILLDTDGIDKNFFRWTVIRGYATIRISDKKGREENSIIKVLGKVDFNIIKEKFKFIQYETDTEMLT